MVSDRMCLVAPCNSQVNCTSSSKLLTKLIEDIMENSKGRIIQFLPF